MYSVPSTADDVKVRWAAGDRIVFMSYQDGWPHLYSVPTSGAAARPALLTPGAFMVEHVALTPDRRFLVYSANTGADRTVSRSRPSSFAAAAAAPIVPHVPVL